MMSHMPPPQSPVGPCLSPAGREYGYGSPTPKPKTSGLAITAFVLSVLFFIPFVPVVGAILGIAAIATMSGKPWLKGRGLAIAAIPTGIVVFLVFQFMIAAIAIPAFMKYTRKAKTVEATEALDKIKVGARSYFMADHYSKTGSLLPRSAPLGDTGWTPDTSCCQGAQKKCQPDAATWQNPLWVKLQFQMSDPHFYQYRYIGTTGGFVIEARGDLDCDGTYSSYKLIGTRSGEQLNTRGPIVTNETE